MSRKYKLWTILTISIATILLGTVITANQAAAATAPVIAVSPFVTGGVGFPKMGNTFSINITLADATKILGYQFFLYYNTTILNATSFVSLPPFTTEYPSFINDTTGKLEMAYITFLADSNGVTTVDPVVIATIDFLVTANGTTALDLQKSRMTDVLGNAVDPIEADGVFSNVEAIQKHDISITGFIISPTTATVGDTVTIDVAVKNNGAFNETFAVSTDYNGTLIRNETGISLKPGANSTISYSWNTANVPAGKYVVTAKASVAKDDFPGDNTRSGQVTISGGGGFSFNIYVIAGIVIVIIVVVAIAVYALRSRKPG